MIYRMSCVPYGALVSRNSTVSVLLFYFSELTFLLLGYGVRWLLQWVMNCIQKTIEFRETISIDDVLLMCSSSVLYWTCFSSSFFCVSA